VAAAWPLGVRAQEPGRTYRLGDVSVSPRNAPYWLVTFDELRRLGFIEGQNLTIDWRDCGQRIDLVSEFVTDLIKAHIDVIYVGAAMVGRNGLVGSAQARYVLQKPCWQGAWRPQRIARRVRAFKFVLRNIFS
jgi:hypothetical protein